MPAYKESSDWRSEIFKVHGMPIVRDLKRYVKREQRFTATKISEDNTLPCVSHLADKYRASILRAVFNELAVLGHVNRQGYAFYLPRKKKVHKNESSSKT